MNMYPARLDIPKISLVVGDVTKIQCRYCRKRTNHSLLFEMNTSDVTNDGLDQWQTIWQVYKCLGCDVVCLICHSGLSSDTDPETGAPDLSEDIYPDPNEIREIVKGISQIPGNIQEIYIETIKAVNSKLYILGAIGIGVTIESICVDKVIPGRGLKEKINNLASQGFITTDGARLLHIAREIRNTSAHESKKFDLKQIEICLDILESLLVNIYTLPAIASEIRPQII